MIIEGTSLQVADNTGARRASCFRILGKRPCAGIGDIIRVAVKEAQPNGMVKKGQVCKALVVRTAHRISRPDGSHLRFDDNACVLIDDSNNPIGGRVFGPVARELRDKGYMKVVSLAPEVI